MKKFKNFKYDLVVDLNEERLEDNNIRSCLTSIWYNLKRNDSFEDSDFNFDLEYEPKSYDDKRHTYVDYVYSNYIHNSILSELIYYILVNTTRFDGKAMLKDLINRTIALREYGELWPVDVICQYYIDEYTPEKKHPTKLTKLIIDEIENYITSKDDYNSIIDAISNILGNEIIKIILIKENF